MPRPWRSGDDGRRAAAGAPSRSGVEDRRRRPPAVTAAGRSAGRGPRSAPPRAASSRASREPGVEAGLRWRSGRAPAASARRGPSSSGRDRRASRRCPGVATAAADRRVGEARSTRSCRSSASRTAPSRDLAPSSAPDRDDRVTIGAGRVMPSAAPASPQDLAGEPGRPASSAIIVSVTRAAQAERRDRRRQLGVDRVQDEASRCRAYSRATPSALDSWPSDASIRSAGPLSALPPMIPLTATTGTPAVAAAASASPCPGTARIGPIETIGFDGAMTTTSAAASAATTSGVGRASSIAAEPDLADVRLLVPADEVLLELEPAVVGQHLGPDRARRSSAGSSARRRARAAGRAPRPSGGSPSRSRSVRHMCVARSRSPSRNHGSSP